MDFPVRRRHPSPIGSRATLNETTEELNRYLVYVRNLGFEDTPDYDYLRELFTQALKNTGEVEDGEYDWMKLNSGKGWEAMKQHPSQIHLHQANGIPNSSQRELHGTMRAPPTSAQLTAARLNAAQPPPPSPVKPGLGKTRERQSASGAVPSKRQSGAAGGFNEIVTTPTTSTLAAVQQQQSSHYQQAQQPSRSNSHLPQRMTAGLNSYGISGQHIMAANPHPTTATTTTTNHHHHHHHHHPTGNREFGPTGETADEQRSRTAIQKLMRVICCGGEFGGRPRRISSQDLKHSFLTYGNVPFRMTDP